MEIDKIEKVHSIGYRLKDAKFTVNQDFKFNVAGVKIEATPYTFDIGSIEPIPFDE